MTLRIESSVVPWLIVSLAPALALAASGCGEDFESCTTTRTCPSGGKAGSAGSAGEGGSAGGAATSGSGGTSTGGGGNGAGGSVSGASGEGAAGNGGDDGSGGSVARGGTGGSGGSAAGDSGSGGEAGDAVEQPDPCESVTCERGECVDVSGEAVCECETGFAGDRCELPSFEWIEPLPGHDSAVALAFSENGTVFGWSCQAAECEASKLWFRWTHQAGTSVFGDSSIRGVTDTNEDASVVVGMLRDTGGATRAFRWTEPSGFVNLGILPGSDTSAARGVNTDGSVVVGESGKQPFRWTVGAGMVPLALPDARPADSSGNAAAVSGDGSVMTGTLSSSTYSVLRWQAANDVEWIEPSHQAYTVGMSADGEVITGWAKFGEALEAFRWTRSTGILSLGRPNGCAATEPAAVSGDGGSIIVYCSDLEETYLWDTNAGLRRVQYVLESAGADVSDAEALQALKLSFDGSMIVGWGRLSGASGGRPWIARLPAIRD